MVGCVESEEQHELNNEKNDPSATYHVILRIGFSTNDWPGWILFQ